MTHVLKDTFYTHLPHGVAGAEVSASEWHRAAATQSLFGQQPRVTAGDMSGEATKSDVSIGKLNHDDAYELGYTEGMANQHKAGLLQRGRQKLESFSTGLASPLNLACFTLAS